MTSLVGQGEVTSADVIGWRGGKLLVHGGDEVAAMSSGRWANQRQKDEQKWRGDMT